MEHLSSATFPHPFSPSISSEMRETHNKSGFLARKKREKSQLGHFPKTAFISFFFFRLRGNNTSVPLGLLFSAEEEDVPLLPTSVNQTEAGKIFADRPRMAAPGGRQPVGIWLQPYPGRSDRRPNRRRPLFVYCCDPWRVCPGLPILASNRMLHFCHNRGEANVFVLGVTAENRQRITFRWSFCKTRVS